MLYNSKAASSKFAQIIRVPEVYLCTTCNMGACDFHMYALNCWACSPWASGIHIRQIPCYNCYILVLYYICFYHILAITDLILLSTKFILILPLTLDRISVAPGRLS